MIDRLSIRTRPPGWPVMYQTWDKLLFLHWPVAAERLQPLIAPRLSLDTFEGQAWVSVSPFTMWGIRPVLLPPLPVVSQSHELNVRTYVHADGVPGVWFFSLDASNTLAVLGARVALGLPYFRARMRLQEEHAGIQFTSIRTHPGAPVARFEGTWARGEPLPSPLPDALDFFSSSATASTPFIGAVSTGCAFITARGPSATSSGSPSHQPGWNRRDCRRPQRPYGCTRRASPSGWASGLPSRSDVRPFCPRQSAACHWSSRRNFQTIRSVFGL